MDNVVISLLSTAAGALLAVVVKHVLANPIRDIAFNIPYLRVKASSLAGYWYAEYGFHEIGNDGSYESVSALYELIEWPVANIVLIREISTGGGHATVVIKAKKRGSYLTGTYENVAAHDTLHGVFQLWIHPRGKEMQGRFLGFSAEAPNNFNVGEWSWVRLTTTRKKEALKEAKKKLVEHRRDVESRPKIPSH